MGLGRMWACGGKGKGGQATPFFGFLNRRFLAFTAIYGCFRGIVRLCMSKVSPYDYRDTSAPVAREKFENSTSYNDKSA